MKETKLVPEAEEFPEVDTLVLESTYFGEEHVPRKETEERFIDSVLETLERGGTAIIPVFAIGRTQGDPVLLDAHGIAAYVDGMGRDPNSKVLLTGYQVEGTNGRLALKHRVVETGGDVLPLRPGIEQYDFSAQSGDSELKKLVKDLQKRHGKGLCNARGQNRGFRTVDL